MEQSSWKADMSSANQEISRILWNINIRYNIPEAAQSNPCLSPLPHSSFMKVLYNLTR
jgi:hypothetical protein